MEFKDYQAEEEVLEELLAEDLDTLAKQEHATTPCLMFYNVLEQHEIM